MADRWKVTVFYYKSKPDIHRNQTTSQVKAYEKRYLRNLSTIRNVKVEAEPPLRIVK